MKITADVGELTKALSTAQKKLNKASQELGRIGSNLSSSISLPLMAIGTVAVNTAQKFEQSMANAASVSGATGEEFEKMTALAREMGKTTVFSASEAADAMYYMASAGYKVEQMSASIAPILNLASATQSELAFTTDTVISTLNQFGLQASDAERVTNVFASVIGNSQATLDKLGYSMRYVGPVAKSLGYSLEETTATLGQLYNAGFKGEQAGTVLRSALSRLIKPTTQIEKVLSEMNLTYADVNPSTNKFADIVGKLEKANINTAQAVALFGQEAGPGMMALISQGSSALLDMESKITGTSAASQMAQRQIETFQGSMKILKSQMEEISITIGNILIPILSKLSINYISPLVEKFNGLSNEGKEFAVKVGVIVASIGPLLLGVSKFLKLLGTFAQIAKIALSPLALKFMAIVAIVLLLVNVFKRLYESNEEFKASVDELLQALQPIFEKLKVLGEAIMKIVGKVFELIMPLLEIVAELFLKLIMNNLEAILPIIEKVLTAFESLFGGIIKLLNGDFKGAFEDFKSFFINLWDGIWTCLKTVINAMIGGINGLLNLIGKGINFITSGLNKLKIDIPEWVPIFGGKTFGFNIPEISMPQIPMLAGGGVIPPNNEFLAVLGDQKSGTNIEAPLETLVSAFSMASSEQWNRISSVLLRKGNGEITVRFEGLSENAFLDALTPKVVGKAKNMGLI